MPKKINNISITIYCFKANKLNISHTHTLYFYQLKLFLRLNKENYPEYHYPN